ncbi:hypothetical protein EMCRGX_G002971 [Ephydatia muelleri]
MDPTKEEVQKQINDKLKKGIIFESSSSRLAPDSTQGRKQGKTNLFLIDRVHEIRSAANTFSAVIGKLPQGQNNQENDLCMELEMQGLPFVTLS